MGIRNWESLVHRSPSPQFPISNLRRSNTVSFPFDLFRLDGRVALITGGAGGLGLVFARALAGAGADVAVLGRRAEAAQAAADAVAAETGRRTLALAADVTNPEQVQAAVDRVRAELG